MTKIEPVVWVDGGHLREVCNGNEMLIFAAPENTDRLGPLYPQSAIDALQAEVERLTRIVEEEQDITEEEALLREIDRELDDVEYLGSYVEGIKELKKQLAACQKDSERLDWLSKHPRDATHVGYDGALKPCYLYGVAGDSALNLREIIDAAVKEIK